ncbi:RNA methyltransferase [Variovorax sp. PCZ-1]|uniref:TrmH family RNA methyltransferase n=1 Tax=Variovorax sp. PCZ-1 TaxID=2835533 RepID=UPI001BCEF5FC|nr:RNA methyltransferase [Variovorax sp. PCZ-1]MBS7806494.1 RNA methyltransferase [Variovorax sp. PCZ-1]
MTSKTEVITSRDNPLVKELRKLAQDGAAYRKTGRVWIEGEHLCDAAQARGRQADIAVISDQKQHLARMECAQSAAKLVVIAEALMREISGLESPAAMGLVLSLPQDMPIEATARSVILDRLQDPGNAGSILRSAAAFGYKQIIALKSTVALWSPKVLRAGMGAHFSLRIVEAASIDQLKDFKLPLAVTSSHRGEFLHELQAQASLSKGEHSAQDASRQLADFAYIFGHEGQGVIDELEALAQAHVRIAQPGGQESLNVAAAAAICLHASAAARVS